MKKLLGEFHTKAFGDLIIDSAVRLDKNTLVVTAAHVATKAELGGQFAGASAANHKGVHAMVVVIDFVSLFVTAPILVGGLLSVNDPPSQANGGSPSPTQPGTDAEETTTIYVSDEI